MKWFSFIALFVLFSSCQKDYIDLEMEPITTPLDLAIHDLVFVSDEIAFLCGGELWEDGFVAKSEDGGNTWQTVLEADNILFSVAFKNELEGVAVGFSGRVWQTENGGIDWNLTESYPNYPVFRDAVFVNDNKAVLAAGNSYYSGGFASYLFNNQQFTDSLINVDFESLHFLEDNKTGFMAGYGTIYKTYNAGNNWEPLDIRGDFFKDLVFNANQEGIVVGYQGKIFTSNNEGNHWEKTAKKANFFSTKGNLESVAIDQREAFICGQNGTLFYADNFLDKSWSIVNHSYEKDFHHVYLRNGKGYLCGDDGLLLKFVY